MVVKKRGRPKKKLTEATVTALTARPEPDFVDLMETVMIRETFSVTEFEDEALQQHNQCDNLDLVTEIKVEDTSLNEMETAEDTF